MAPIWKGCSPSPCMLFPEQQMNKIAISCALLGTEIPGPELFNNRDFGMLSRQHQKDWCWFFSVQASFLKE